MKNIFKIASLLAAAVVLFSCEKVETEGNGLQLVSDKDVIQADGKDAATLKVMYNGKDVTAEAVIYDSEDNELNLPDGKFTATEVGEYKFYADYGTMSTFNKGADDKGLYAIKAIDVPVPVAVPDPQPTSAMFVHRAFLTQYTGTACGYCPFMIRQVRELVADKVIPTKAVHASSHSGPFTTGDPAKIDNGPQSPGSYPYMHVDLVNGYTHQTGISVLRTLIDNSIASAAKAGISVSPAYYSEEGCLVVKVAVKAAVDGIFNVGAWLLEDGIYGAQSDKENIGDDSYDIHENCVRIADSKYKGTWFGHELGSLSKGEVAEKTFVMNLKRSWEVENLHLAVFVSYGEPKGSRIAYTVCNAVDVPIDAPTPFEYVK